jgi:hypothetical protein
VKTARCTLQVRVVPRWFTLVNVVTTITQTTFTAIKGASLRGILRSQP